MKMHQDSEETKTDKKSLKPQVERRRRERMNRSLDNLKTLLLQQQVATQRRVEKAEILEQTVLFLQTCQTQRNKARGGAGAGGGAGGGGGGAGGGGGGGGGQKFSYQDGFSSCLQTAAHFLGPEGKGLSLGVALDASLSSRFPDPARSSSSSLLLRNSSSSLLLRNSSSSLLLRNSSRSMLRLLIHRSGHRLRTPVQTTAAIRVQTHGGPHQCRSSAPPQPHKEVTQNPGVSPALWRPWP